MKKIIILLLLLLCVSGFAEPLTVRQILKAMKKASVETSYKAVSTSVSDGKTNRFMYCQKVNPDGTIYKLHYPLDMKTDMRFLENDKGNFEIIGSTAIKKEYYEGPKPLPPPSVPVRKDENTFIMDGKEFSRERVGEKNFAILERMSKNDGDAGLAKDDSTVEEVNYQGRDCYLIKYRYPTVKNGMYTTEKIVDKNNFFTYSDKAFNASGKCVRDVTCSEIEFNPSFPSDFFDLPKDAQIVVINSREERSGAVIAASDKRRAQSQNKAKSNSLAGWGNSVGRKISDLFWSNITAISYAFAILAGGVLIFAGIVKVKRRL